MQITEQFSLEEFKQPARHNLPEIAYPEEWIPILKELCEQLEIIRAIYNQPITIISGYRSPEYNMAIRGAEHSQHMLGRAADIVIKDINAGDVHEAILKLMREDNLALKGLGYYPNNNPLFNHVDIREGPTSLWIG